MKTRRRGGGGGGGVSGGGGGGVTRGDVVWWCGNQLVVPLWPFVVYTHVASFFKKTFSIFIIRKKKNIPRVRDSISNPFCCCCCCHRVTFKLQITGWAHDCDTVTGKRHMCRFPVTDSDTGNGNLEITSK